MIKRVAAVLVLMLSAVASPAGAGAARTEELPYGFEANPGTTSGSVRYSSTAVFETQSTERFVTLEVLDESGQPVAFDARQGPRKGIDADGCGTTAAPLEIRGGKDLEVATLFQIGQAGECLLSLPTSGVIRATFTR